MKSRFATSAAPRPATNSSSDRVRSPLRSPFLNATVTAYGISVAGSSANNPLALLIAMTKTIATHTDRLTNHVDPSITIPPQELRDRGNVFAWRERAQHEARQDTAPHQREV